MKVAPQTVVEALTRSTVRRDLIGLEGTDQQLLNDLCGECSRRKIEYLAAVSRLLRLLDSLLSGQETGEGLAEKYFIQFRALRKEFGDAIGSEAQILEAFDEATQLFSCVKEGEPVAALISLEEIRRRADDTYGILRRWWESALDQLITQC